MKMFRKAEVKRPEAKQVCPIAAQVAVFMGEWKAWWT